MNAWFCVEAEMPVKANWVRKASIFLAEGRTLSIGSLRKDP